MKFAQQEIKLSKPQITSSQLLDIHQNNTHCTGSAAELIEIFGGIDQILTDYLSWLCFNFRVNLSA